jgi:hypothetical protein
MSEAETALLVGYEWAIVRLATCLPDDKKDQPSLLVFASVEFVHSDRPKPDSTPLDNNDVPPHIRSERSSGSKIYFRRVAMRAADALAWYRNAAAGSLVTPLAADEADRGRHDGGSLRAPPLIEEPPWPRLAFPISDQSLFGGDAYYPTPFVGPGAAQARIHRLMAAADPDLDGLARDPIVCTWLASRLHFRIDEYPELLGSIALIAPDPQVRSVKQYFARDKQGKERFVTQLQPRSGKNLDGLELTILEERFGAMSTFVRRSIPPNGTVVTEAPAEIRTSGFMLAHPERGLIGFQPPLPFIRTVGITTELASRRVQVHARDSKKKGAKVTVHEFGEFAPAFDSVIGDTTPPLDAHARYFESVGRRRVSGQARQNDQRWIDDVAGTRAFLRGLVGSARQEVFVADCFFGGEELSSYLHFVHRLDVHIKVLTSSEAFGGSELKAESIRNMQTNLISFQDRGLTNIEVHVMDNKDGGPILHDRFLAVDGVVWFSGNSFNAIGQRESMIVKLPDPAAALVRLEHIFQNRSTDFETFANLGEG